MLTDDHIVWHATSLGTAVPRGIKKALDHFRSSNGGAVTVAEIFAACGLPERTLHKRFRRFVGLSPLGHLRWVRLLAARADLLACDGRGSVTDIATRHGFTHLGRFAVMYRRCFGECPSATLHRSPLAADDPRSERADQDAPIARMNDVPHGPHLP